MNRSEYDMINTTGNEDTDCAINDSSNSSNRDNN